MSIIVNARISFVFALMKCCFAAFREQNKIDNDSKCQQVYKSLKKSRYVFTTPPPPNLPLKGEERGSEGIMNYEF